MTTQTIKKIFSFLSSKQDKIRNDTYISRIFNTLLVLVFLSCACKMSYELCFGTTISCGFHTPKTKSTLTFCWKNSVYDLPEEFKDVCSTKDMKNTGKVSNSSLISFSLLLLLSSVCCYLPRLMWNFQEKGILSRINRKENNWSIQDSFPTKDCANKKPSYFNAFLYSESAYFAVLLAIYIIGTVTSTDYEFASFGIANSSLCSKTFQSTVLCEYPSFDKYDDFQSPQKTFCTLEMKSSMGGRPFNPIQSTLFISFLQAEPSTPGGSVNSHGSLLLALTILQLFCCSGP